MSYEYAMSRVRDAIEKSGGNHLKAQRLVLQWVEKDHSLLFGLVTPHLQSIISHAVNHADAPAKKEMPKRVAPSRETGEFGAAIVDSLEGALGGGGGGVGFGQATPKNLSKPGVASKSHVDAINAIINAGKKKDTKKK